MMSHLRILVLSFVILLYSGWVSALGLGDLTLNSSLNEPFDAEVAVLNAGELDIEQLFAKLASSEDFQRAGVDRELYLLDLRFKLNMSKPGKPVIQITSTRPVREPYLDFLVQLQWPSGRLLKEYTVFLDLPVFADKQQASRTSLRQPGGSADQGIPKKKDVPSPARQSETSASPVAGSSSQQTGSYRVQSGDTLWGIANQNRPQGSSIHQAMQAIYERNSAAFIDGNMNALRKGALLNMPDAKTISAVDDRLAKSQVALSVEDLQSQIERPDLISSGPAGRGESEATTQSDGVLRLLSTDDGLVDGAGAGGAGETEGIAGEVFQNNLAIAQENLSKSNRENQELRKKIAQLEEQLSTMSRLVELGDDELSVIQLGLGEEEGSGVASESSQLPVDDSAEFLEDESSVLVEEVAEFDSSTELATETEQAQPQGVLAGIRDKLTVIAAALLVIVLGVLFLLSRRRKDQDETTPSSLNRHFAYENEQSESNIEEPELERLAKVDGEANHLYDTGVEDELADGNGVVESEHGEVDPIGEADIYLSFGDYGQAETIINRALEAEPNDSRLHLKRLEVLNAQGDLVRFDEYYPELVALGDSSAIESADRIRGTAAIESDELTEELLTPPDESLSEERSTESVFETERAGQELDSIDEEINTLDRDSGLDEESSLSTLILDEDGELDNEDLDLDLDPDLLELDEVETEVESEQQLELDHELPQLGDIELDLDPDDEVEVELDQDVSSSKSEFDDFDIDADLDLLVDGDEIATQLELAQAYIDMGDKDGAKDILDEVIANGSAEQKAQAQEILTQTT